MTSRAPDHRDADLVLRVYELRREPVMRESRDAINRDFWPADEAAVLAVLQPDHPLNRAWRQVSTYWEMVYGMARHGIVPTDYLLESNAEGLLLYAKVEPHLAAIRAATSPRALLNAQWIAGTGDVAAAVMKTFRDRVAKRLAAR